MRPRTRLGAFGDGLRRHGDTIRTMQWCVVGLYLVLLIVPAVRPLPPAQARVIDDVTVAAQFVFWGVWWPFVLLSMVVVGRAWCGLFCPEGALSEWASRHGRQRAIPGWIRWGGWPTVAFTATTVYGQMISVYQYPKAALLVLGGSTAAAMAVGYLYGRDKRVWCRYLCPAGGVFRLLAQLAPLHFHVDGAAWARGAGESAGSRVNCAPLVAIRTMTGAADCHMCGRCSGYRGAVTLTARAANAEIVAGRGVGSAWNSALLLYGLIGVAMGAFHWNASPWFVAIKHRAAAFLVDRDFPLPLEQTAPWWLLTNYPAQNDVFNLLDGALLIAYIAATALAVGSALSVCVGVASRCLAGTRAAHHLAQALVPLAGCGVFLGLSGLTIAMLRFEGMPVFWVPGARAAILTGAAAWSLWLAWRISGRHAISKIRQIAATAAMSAASGLVVAGWTILFWFW